ncbi:Activator of Hsp90 ATPase 1 family protein [Beutenbergia cavernae DSM 12333]|uniref:Activator of Hsp90 ATPase 1 family protein n=1 Tax=Beutenbergia cavernae (strain ATCC BAA-8 / DSM 12333 / CCUG 43141 / JCM 11478 / NBRC 16432 / NCIMB 13614 / HKI 0122) TaxID=471853 RepID=C5C0D1_BEUC1|nr:SRPBCC domain-containing protein [Beutenbergia cavernae]ACQ79317.1 Activator of Hsp90 ATPase 1 family protein [Beutenbergia cavernae DSM 12333]
MTEAPTTVRLTRHVAAAPARVWRAWTDADELAAWFWPPSFGTTARVDLRVGGTYRVESTARGMAVSGDVVALEEPHRLVLTWRWDGEDDETLVTVTFAAADGGTDVVVLHERFTSEEDAANHAQGWNDCLDRLVEVGQRTA